MSSAPITTSTPLDFNALFDCALADYTKRTGNDLHSHPLASIIDRCDSSDSILAIFQEQSRAFDEFKNGDSRLIKSLGSLVNRLRAISTSAVTSTGASLAFPPANIIFSATGVLLSAAKYVRNSYDVLVDIFDCIENFLSRLKIYTEITPTPAMTEIVIKIMVELLAVLALATKQIKQGRLKKYARKLLGERDVESVLQRLDRLTLEESKMTVALTLDVVHGLINNMQVVMEDGKVSIDDIHQALELMQEMVTEVNKMERDRLRANLRQWLSAPDPWSNQNNAREAHYRGTANWFTQGDVFEKWKSTGRLLWINGLPGSGKTVLCSSIIMEIQNMCKMGLATMSFFYFDFRDHDKQDIHHLLSSILIQLCNQSDKYSESLSTLFTSHSRGSRQPSEDTLLECLKNMLKIPGQGPLYLIIDALDECPNSSGCPTPRELALAVMQELVGLQLSHVRFCVTSRPEVDIRDVLGPGPLGIYDVSLHEQAGQNQDIVDYIGHFIRSDPKARQWRAEDKQLVIETLSRKAGGMFRWVYCQLETLRRCFPPSVRPILGELPETLDETYERTLMGIDEEKQVYANRLFQCLAISIRPLRVEELAELFAFPVDAESTSEFNINWRPEDPDASILSACSQLVTIVDDRGDKVVQFSHFSVKEYLTSHRIANSAPVSHFHILPKLAHTLLARACLGVLLQLDYILDKTMIQNFPLARYAAEHWVEHAQFEDVSVDIQDMMDCLFDSTKPHFAAWLWLCDGDNNRRTYRRSPSPTRPGAEPLYYAALYGLRGLAERLLDAHPQDVNAWGGYYYTPLLAALNKDHPTIALLLLERGANAEPRGRQLQTALYAASSRGYTEVIHALIVRGADINAICDDTDNRHHVRWTPLRVALDKGRLEIAKLLLDHGADVNYQDNDGKNLLHIALRHSSIEITRLLLDYGADPNAFDTCGETPLHDASSKGQITVVVLLLKHGAHVDVRNKSGSTPLHKAARGGRLEIVQLLLDHGADVNAQREDRWTALHVAAYNGRLQVVEVLVKRGADTHAKTSKGKIPFQLASEKNYPQVAHFLSEHSGETM